LRAQQEEMRKRLDGMSSDLKTAQVITPNPSRQTIKERITTLQGRRAELSTRYAEDSQVLRNLSDEIAALQQILDTESLTLVASETSEANPLRQNFIQSIEQFDVKIAGVQASVVELSSIADRVASQLQKLDAGEAELHIVERELKIAEENYVAFTRRGEEALIDEALDQSRITNISVLRSPSSSIEPVYPPKLLVMGLSLPLGLVLGIGFVLISEYFGDRISTSRDVESIEGLHYLGSFRFASSAEELPEATPA
jgi:uncharacterized protein involved in exopolysaccharide biosynthesis